LDVVHARDPRVADDLELLVRELALDRLGEIGALGEKAVARVHGIRSALARGRDQSLDPQVALARGARTDRIRFVGQTDVQSRSIALGKDRHRRSCIAGHASASAEPH